MTKKKKIALISGICIITVTIVALAGTIVSLQKTVQSLSKQQASSTAATGEYSSEIHEIYDGTAVVAAYKNGDSSKLNEKDKYVLNTTSKILKDKIQDRMTDYDKEKIVYDWLFHYATYDESSLAAISDDNDNYTPYGVLKARKRFAWEMQPHSSYLWICLVLIVKSFIRLQTGSMPGIWLKLMRSGIT